MSVSANQIDNIIEFKKNVQEVLKNALQPDQALRKAAEDQIDEIIASNYSLFIGVLGEIILDESMNIAVRNLASIILKNTFLSEKYFKFWIGCCPEDAKESFRSLLKRNLNIKRSNFLSTISTVLGTIARIEITNTENNRLDIQFFNEMQSGITNTDYCVGILNTIVAAVGQLYDHTNYSFQETDKFIYNICTFYLYNSQGENIEIVEAMLNAISECMEVFNVILKDYNEQNKMCRGLLEMMKTNQAAFDTINIFAETILQDGRVVLLPEICNFYNQNYEGNLLQFCEFYQILSDSGDCVELQTAMPTILPILFGGLTKEDSSISEWTEHKASSALLVSLTEHYGDLMLNNPISQGFIVSKLNSSDPLNISIGAIALGSICNNDSEKNIREFLLSALNILLKYASTICCSTEVLYAIAKICGSTDISVSEFSNAATLALKIVESNDDILIVENAIWVINALFAKRNLFEGLSEAVTGIVYTLVRKVDSLPSKSQNNSIKNAINSTLSEIIKKTSDITLIFKIAIHFTARIQEIKENIYSGSYEELLILEDILCGYIAVTTDAVSTLYSKCMGLKETESAIESYLNSLISLQTIPSNIIKGEIFLSFSKLIDACSNEHISSILETLLSSISKRDRFVSETGLNLLSDIFISGKADNRSLLKRAIPLLIDIILTQNSVYVTLKFKTAVMEVFGTIALTCGNDFDPFIDMSVVLFRQINSCDIEKDSMAPLFAAVIKFISCIIVGSGDSVETRNHLRSIISEIKCCITNSKGKCDEELVDLIADIFRTFKHSDKKDFGSYLLAVGRQNDGTVAKKALELYNKYIL